MPLVAFDLAERTHCRTPGYGVIKVIRGRPIITRCEQPTCSYCLGIEVDLRKEAILDLAQPERWVILTQVGAEWQGIQGRLNRFGSFVRKRCEFQYVYTVEPQSGGHANLLVRPLPPRRVLEAAARNQGLGRLWIDPRPLTARAVAYVFKYAIRSPEKYLLLNGGRLTHQSVRFFPGGLKRAVEEVRARRSTPIWTKYSGKLSQPEYAVTEEEIDQLLSGPPEPFRIGESPVEKLLDSLWGAPFLE